MNPYASTFEPHVKRDNSESMLTADASQVQSVIQKLLSNGPIKPLLFQLSVLLSSSNDMNIVSSLVIPFHKQEIKNSFEQVLEVKFDMELSKFLFHLYRLFDQRYFYEWARSRLIPDRIKSKVSKKKNILMQDENKRKNILLFIDRVLEQDELSDSDVEKWLDLVVRFSKEHLQLTSKVLNSGVYSNLLIRYLRSDTSHSEAELLIFYHIAWIFEDVLQHKVDQSIVKLANSNKDCRIRKLFGDVHLAGRKKSFALSFLDFTYSNTFRQHHFILFSNYMLRLQPVDIESLFYSCYYIHKSLLVDYELNQDIIKSYLANEYARFIILSRFKTIFNSKEQTLLLLKAISEVSGQVWDQVLFSLKHILFKLLSKCVEIPNINSLYDYYNEFSIEDDLAMISNGFLSTFSDKILFSIATSSIYELDGLDQSNCNETEERIVYCASLMINGEYETALDKFMELEEDLKSSNYFVIGRNLSTKLFNICGPILTNEESASLSNWQSDDPNPVYEKYSRYNLAVENPESLLSIAKVTQEDVLESLRNLRQKHCPRLLKYLSNIWSKNVKNVVDFCYLKSISREEKQSAEFESLAVKLLSDDNVLKSLKSEIWYELFLSGRALSDLSSLFSTESKDLAGYYSESLLLTGCVEYLLNSISLDDSKNYKYILEFEKYVYQRRLQINDDVFVLKVIIDALLTNLPAKKGHALILRMLEILGKLPCSEDVDKLIEKLCSSCSKELFQSMLYDISRRSNRPAIKKMLLLLVKYFPSEILLLKREREILDAVENQVLLKEVTLFINEMRRLSVLPEELFHRLTSTYSNEAGNTLLNDCVSELRDYLLRNHYDAEYFEAYVKSLSEKDKSKHLKLRANIKLEKSIKFEYLSLNQKSLDCLKENVIVLNSKTKPKKLHFKTVDGEDLVYLLKGNEDLNLDCIILRLIESMNEQMNPKSHYISCAHTYHVLPLDENFGLIEWVQNSQSFYSIVKPYLKEPPIESFQDIIKGQKLKKASRKENIQCYYNVFSTLSKSISSRIIRRQIFINSKSEIDNYFNVVKFSKSYAANAVIGYLIGLGDRHLDNILLKSNCEVVNVDYNICFELGRTLRIPETVPFRLTQNVRDLVNERKWIFINSMQETMKLYRQYSEIIMLQLGVLVDFPIKNWRSIAKFSSITIETPDSLFDLFWHKKIENLMIKTGVEDLNLLCSSKFVEATFRRLEETCKVLLKVFRRIKADKEILDSIDRLFQHSKDGYEAFKVVNSPSSTDEYLKYFEVVNEKERSCKTLISDLKSKIIELQKEARISTSKSYRSQQDQIQDMESESSLESLDFSENEVIRVNDEETMLMIQKVDRKLKGLESSYWGGSSSSKRDDPLTVEEHVSLIFNAAIDERRLCLMYEGWTAWI